MERGLGAYWDRVSNRGLLLLCAGCRIGFEPVPGLSSDGGGGDGRGAIGDNGALVTAPIAAWPFDEGSGQAVADQAMIEADGVLGTSDVVELSDPNWVTASTRVCAGAGLSFDGNDDIVTISGPSRANLTRFSIAFSLFVTGPGSSWLPRILSKEAVGVGDLMIGYRAFDDAIAIYLYDTSNAIYATLGTGVIPNQRANWVVTYDDEGDRRVHVYKNGDEAAYLRQDPMVGPLRVTTQAWMIGNETSGSRGFDGTLDDVRIYDTVIGAAEITALSARCPP